MIALTTQRLRVELAEPNESPNVGFRFDRAAFLSDVVLDGGMHFCAAEPRNLVHPSSGGRGLCCEFDADLSGDVSEGERYPKLGVGLIVKDGAYCFHRAYADVRAFPVRVAHGADWAEFHTDALPCAGYAVKGFKRVTVADRTVTLEACLENVGDKPLVINEYCHNFLSIDGMAISPDYRLELPLLPELDGCVIKNDYPNRCNFIARKGGIDFARCEREVSLAALPLRGVSQELPFRWRLSHSGAKAWIDGEDSVTPARLTLWATDHIVSPEIIQRFAVAPGQSHAWTRKWTFNKQ